MEMRAASAADERAIEALRVRRAELRSSMSALEHALAAPAPGRLDAWTERVHVALVELYSDFREHVAIAEGPDGVYADFLGGSPRLSDQVSRLTDEHAEISGLLDDLLRGVGGVPERYGVEQVRELGTALLVRLIRSRQRSADLVYEAYQSDLGGEA